MKTSRNCFFIGSGDALAFFPTQSRKLRKIVRENFTNLPQVYSTVSMAGKKGCRVFLRNGNFANLFVVVMYI